MGLDRYWGRAKMALELFGLDVWAERMETMEKTFDEIQDVREKWKENKRAGGGVVFMTPEQVDELKYVLDNLNATSAPLTLDGVDFDLTPEQVRNVNRYFNKAAKVLDRD